MAKYFRVKAHHPKENLTVVVDSYGKYDEIWQLSSFLIKKGFRILQVWDDGKITDVDFPKVNTINKTHIYVRSCKKCTTVYDGIL